MDTELISFPRDHYFHAGKYSVEWHYFWGKLSTGQFFYFTEHYVMLGGNRIKYIHYGIDGKYKEEVESWNEDFISSSGFAGNQFFFKTPELQLVFNQKTKPVIHPRDLPRSNYYSIPYLEGKGVYKGKEVTAICWFDHEFSEWSIDVLRKVNKWDWVGIQLNANVYIMAWVCGISNICDVTFKNETVVSDFKLSKDNLDIDSLGMSFNLKPLFKEKTFKPKLGIEYSEQPFEVFVNKKIVGFGMRERAYIKEK